METKEMTKSDFYLFKSNDESGREYYIQNFVSPSVGYKQLTNTFVVDFAWRGLSCLDIKKMLFIISQDPFQKKINWELVKYRMNNEIPSFSETNLSFVKYDNILPEDFELILTEKEEREFENFKKKF